MWLGASGPRGRRVAVRRHIVPRHWSAESERKLSKLAKHVERGEERGRERGEERELNNNTAPSMEGQERRSVSYRS